ncbi:MAG: hypothetical protein IID12_00650 [Candidatus Marinimicrobia bacterium]|nr:hypothetical protein [Candidatus Neomarinimicrobiota bacterium]
MKLRIIKQIRRIFSLKEGEGARTALMFSFIFLLVTSLLIVKPVRNSLFLVNVGISKLPYAFILVAVFSAIVVTLFSKYSTKFHVGKLLRAVLDLSILSLLAFWALFYFGVESVWIIYIFYIWVSIFGVITTMQFWLLSNYIFTSREAKRLFGLVGAGGISGGIFGGYLTNFIAPRLGTENLILLSAVFLFLCIFIGRYAWVNYGKKNYAERHLVKTRTKTQSIPERTISVIFKSKYLTLLMGIVGVSVLVANLADYQFNLIASETIQDEDKLTAFFGFWLSNLSILSLLIQLFITGRMINYFGVGISLLLLPIGILIGAGAIIINPGIYSALLIKVNDGALKQSINKAARELLSLPIAAEVKNRVKAFIDVFVDNFATGVSGILLLIATLVFVISVQQISWIIIFFILIWLYMIYKIKSEYVNSFRMAIEKRFINFEEEPYNLNDASILNSLYKALEGDNERQILYVLSLIENVKSDGLIPRLKKLLQHKSAEVKSKALKLISEFDRKEFYELVLPLVEDPDMEVKTNAIIYLYDKSENPNDFISEYLQKEDLKIKIATMMCVAEDCCTNSELRKSMDIEEIYKSVFAKESMKLLEPDKVTLLKINAANFIGTSLSAKLYNKLIDLFEDDSIDVKKSAVINMGKTASIDFLEFLIENLNNSDLKVHVRDAITRIGEDAIGLLSEKLKDEKVDYLIRKAIPDVLARIYSDSQTNALLEQLPTSELGLRFEMIKSLNKLKTKFPAMRIDNSIIQKTIALEVNYYYKLSSILSVEKKALNSMTENRDEEALMKARRLLIISIEDKFNNILERIFRLLGLLYLSSDMYNAYLGIASRNKNIKADAIEFLDNSLSRKLKSTIIPIIETDTPDSLAEKAMILFEISFENEEQCIYELMEDDSNWLKACSIYLANALNGGKYTEKFESFVNDPDAIVRETAEHALMN